ncbi:MAG: amidohydrolase family protein [Candidatus Parcubacteria bacterium]|nr:amidohydrolase family protein [Burkholderiales bacterium]
MGAIDFRFRPVGTQSITRELTYEYLRKMRLSPAPSFERQDIDLMFREMDEAGIEMGVIGVPAPTDKPGFVSTANKTIADLVKRHPKRFVGFGSLDAADPAGALEEIGRVVDLGLVGLTLEPSTSRVRRRFDDRVFYPIYEEAQKRALPLLTVMSCLLGPYMDDCHPELVDHVATDFPELTLVIQHGAWPYAREACGLAYKQKNVYLVPGQYAHYEFPGSEDYVKGANRQLADQMLFGSVYPNCGPLSEVMQIVDRLGFANDEIKAKYLGGNARRLLGLGPARA